MVNKVVGSVLIFVLSLPIAKSEEVVELSGDSLDRYIRESPWLFVEFYAPWCGHCKKLAPEWERTATLAKSKGLGVPLAKVDAIANKEAAKEHDVAGFPTLKLFHGSSKVSIKYNGGRTADKMVSWLQSWKESDLVDEVSGWAVAEGWLEKKPIAFLGVKSSTASDDNALMSTHLEQLAFTLNPMKPGSEVPVGVLSSSDTVPLSDLPQLPCIIMLRNFDFEEKIVVKPSEGAWKTMKFEDTLVWAQKWRVPTLVPARQDMEQFLLHDIKTGHGLCILFGGTAAQKTVMHKLAVEHSKTETRLKWVHAQDDDFGKGLAASVSLNIADFPELIVWEFGEADDDDKVYRYSQQSGRSLSATDGLSEEHLKGFIAAWQSGSLSAEADLVVTATSADFEKWVYDENRDVLVEFYAPWCGHCQALAPHYKKLAKHYENDPGIRIVKVDATQHKHRSAVIKSYPTLKFYKKGAKEKPIDVEFKSRRDTQSLVEVVEKHRTKKGQAGTTTSTTTAASSPKKQQQDGKQKGSKSKEEVRMPCPEDADITSCQAWCRGVSPRDGPAYSGAFGGTKCAELLKSSKSPSHNEFPQCTCYDKDYKNVYAYCVSPCKVTGTKQKTTTPTPTTSGKAEMKTEHSKEGPGTCSAGSDAASCQGASFLRMTKPGLSRRYLLYDTKYGEGFNLQREVFPRAGWLVAELNKLVKSTCSGGSKAGTLECLPWTLVLPPWCRVVHWWTGRQHVPWKAFFDDEVLKGSKVDVIEFEDYAAIVGGSVVDVAVAYTTDKTEMNTGRLLDPNLKLSGGEADFLGWTDLMECNGKRGSGRELSDWKQLSNGSYAVSYGGQCEGGLTAGDFRCGVFKSPFPRCTVDMLRSLMRSDAGSVLIKSYDYMLSPDSTDLDDLGLREAMLYSKEIRSYADGFIQDELKGKPFLAAHCRRTDFLRVRSKTTPQPADIAAKLNEVMASRGLSQVFIATDAPKELGDELRPLVTGSIHFFTDGAAGAKIDHPGKQAAAEMWIAARADFFIGTIESRFTMSIQLERGFLGKPVETSSMEFCKEFPEKKPCMAPKYRQPKRKSPTRREYF